MSDRRAAGTLRSKAQPTCSASISGSQVKATE